MRVGKLLVVIWDSAVVVELGGTQHIQELTYK